MIPNLPTETASDRRAWLVCGVVLLATMLNYMDRQTLAQLATEIKAQLSLTNAQYGELELGFGIAFAAGAIAWGFVVDRFGVRWTYPLVVLGWSAAGFATAFASSYAELLACRIVLGAFEAGQWPCALKTSQQLLSVRDRPLGNSIVQAGASLGAIATPVAIQLMASTEPGAWRLPFAVIGGVGVAWLVPWAWAARDPRLARHAEPPAAALPAADANPWAEPSPPTSDFARRYAVAAVVVIAINLCWHFFRAWMPSFLKEHHHYDATTVNWFSSVYYIVTDLGCVAIGWLVRWMSGRGWSVHGARVAGFALCCAMTAMSVAAAVLPAGPALLGTLLVVGFGALPLFPIYYSLSQDLSTRNQGKVTGSLSAITWTCTAVMQRLVGGWVDARGSFAEAILASGLWPLVGLAALAGFWNWPIRARRGGDRAASG